MTDPQDWAAPGARPPEPVPPNSPQGQPGPRQAGSQYPGSQYPGAPQPGSPGEPGMPPGPPWGNASAAPKPGVIPLRPLGVGEILDGAVSYVRANPVATLGLAAIVVTITQLLQLPVAALAVSQMSGLAAVPPDQVGSDDVAGIFGSTIAGGSVAAIVTFVATTVLSGMLMVVLSQAVLGRKMSIGEAWAAVRGRIAGLLGLTLLTALLLVLVMIVGFIPLVIAGVTESGAVAVVGVLFLLAALGVMAWLGVSWALAAPAYVLEGIAVTEALRRSFRLVRTQWWRVFGILLLGGIIAGLIGLILELPFSFAADAVGGSLDPTDPFGGTTMVGVVVASIGTIIAGTVTAPFSAGISGLLYFDQRIRREALDIELARAAQQ